MCTSKIYFQVNFNGRANNSPLVRMSQTTFGKQKGINTNRISFKSFMLNKLHRHPRVNCLFAHFAAYREKLSKANATQGMFSKRRFYLCDARSVSVHCNVK